MKIVSSGSKTQTHCANSSVWSTALFAVAFLQVLCLFHAWRVFVQFSTFELIKIQLCFVALLVMLMRVFIGDAFKASVRLGSGSILVGITLSVYLWLLSNTFLDGQFAYYFRTFPLLETDLGLGWHQDTAFHVSLIQSIMNFGYPSVALHGTPPLFYHVLSHYVDALFLLLSGLDPYDSYGLLGWFKSVSFLSVAIIFLAYFARHLGLSAFFVLSIFLLPLMAGTWHVVGSHSMWVTSILLVLATPFLYEVLTRIGYANETNLLRVFFLVVVISIGKVSTGFMLAIFFGLAILQKYPRRPGTYVLAVAWLAFFYIQQELFSDGSSVLAAGPIDTAEHFEKFFKYTTKHLILGFLSCTALLSALVAFRRASERVILISGIFTLLISYALTLVLPSLSVPDISYFQYGASSVIFLFSIASLLSNSSVIKSSSVDGNSRRAEWALAPFLVLALIPALSSFYVGYNIFGYLKSTKTNHFEYINRALPKNRAVTLLNSRESFLADYNFQAHQGLLSELRRALNDQLRDESLNKQNSVLFVPKEIFDLDLVKLRGTAWARGLLVYAVTGVPMANAVPGNTGRYGLKGFGSSAFQLPLRAFDSSTVCQELTVSHILILESLYPAQLTVFRCKP